MPTKIRLQRHGKKGRPYYRIVVADSRAPRDGRFIENLGTYNPLTIPATIEINQDRALYWLQTGAQPTDTTRAILSYKGILYKNHLLKGVSKGALTEEQADVKFEAWKTEKEKSIAKKIKEKELAEKNTIKKQQENEIKIKEERANAIAEKKAKISEKEKASAPVSQTEKATEEIPVAEAAATEQPVAEIKAEEIVTETPAVEETKAKEIVTEIKGEEKPIIEDKAEETAVVKTKKRTKKEEPVLTTEEKPIVKTLADEETKVQEPTTEINPRKLYGDWNEGYALDLHTLSSKPIRDTDEKITGWDTKRPPIGEQLYQLKYQRKQYLVETIARTAADFLNEYKSKWQLNLIIPIPPSDTIIIGRFQPVYEVAKAIGEICNLTVDLDILKKTKSTEEIKGIEDPEKRREILKDAFSIESNALNGKNVLLFDDLYRSGTTLNEVCNIIMNEGKASSVYVLAITKTRTKK